ncbi:MAG TPA: hypothetical protein VGG66_10805 [Rhizomicrobium sp.]|jgi:hypothetical protein
MSRVIALLLLLEVPASAQTLQQDCRGPGSVGTAVMSVDGTITLNFTGPIMRGVLAYHRGEPQYARIISHIGGIQPAQKKSVPPWC